jgi:hypothetical protein
VIVRILQRSSLTCEGGQSFSGARLFGPDEPVPGPALRSRDYGLAHQEVVGVEGLDPGHIIVFDGEVVSREADAPGFVRLLVRIARSRRELVVVCPADTELGTARRGEFRGLLFDKPLAAGRLGAGQVVAVDGRVLKSGPDPDDTTPGAAGTPHGAWPTPG